MTRREEMLIKSRERKEKEIADFLADVEILHDESRQECPYSPYVSIKKEYDENYVEYTVMKYNERIKYSIVYYRKEYPFSIYYSREYNKKGIPNHHIKQFEELEAYFN